LLSSGPRTTSRATRAASTALIARSADSLRISAIQVTAVSTCNHHMRLRTALRCHMLLVWTVQRATPSEVPPQWGHLSPAFRWQIAITKGASKQLPYAVAIRRLGTKGQSSRAEERGLLQAWFGHFTASPSAGWHAAQTLRGTPAAPREVANTRCSAGVRWPLRSRAPSSPRAPPG